MLCLVAQSCLALCNPMECSPPGSSLHGILQASILEWVATPFSRGFSQPRFWTQVSRIAGGFFTILSHQESPRILEWLAYPFPRGSRSNNHIKQKLETTQCPSRINKMGWILAREYDFPLKKGGNSDTGYNTDEPWRLHVESSCWQIVYVRTYKRVLEQSDS